MNKYYPIIILSFFVFLCFTGCIGSKLGSAKKHESVFMSAPPKRDVINYAQLKKQQEKPLSMASRGEIVSRGPETAFAGGLVSLGVNAVRQVIANENKKYVAQWRQGLNDLYFYDQPSADGPLDPTGMQFNGFSITRTFEDQGSRVTALTADFEVDKDSVASNEIINDAIFRLKLKSVKLNFAKAKVPANKDTLNVDFDIVFLTSYIGRDGQMFKDVELGRFFLSLRKAPLDSAKAGYKEYYDKLKNKRLDGKCFIVPRSYGYYKTPDNTIVPLYNQGLFSIGVTVTECSKANFVDKMLIRTSDLGLDLGQGLIMRAIKK
jgi:hypothetical protein